MYLWFLHHLWLQKKIIVQLQDVVFFDSKNVAGSGELIRGVGAGLESVSYPPLLFNFVHLLQVGLFYFTHTDI